MQTERFLVAGMSGSGKSIYARALAGNFSNAKKFDQLIIVNRKSEMSDLVSSGARYAIDESIRESMLTRILNQHKKVFFRVDGYDPREFLNALGNEIMRRRFILLLIEEASEFVPRGKAPKQLFRILTAGRERGHSVIAVTQMLQSAMAGIDLAFMQQATTLVSFRLQGENDVARLSEFFPELGEGVKTLKSHDGLPPEYGIKNMVTSRCGIMRRDPHNPTRRTFIELTRSQPQEVQQWQPQQAHNF
jgi:energy-coupling factor transporter ATP-binding protein EcfA2